MAHRLAYCFRFIVLIAAMIAVPVWASAQRGGGGFHGGGGGFHGGGGGSFHGGGGFGGFHGNGGFGGGYRGGWGGGYGRGWGGYGHGWGGYGHGWGGYGRGWGGWGWGGWGYPGWGWGWGLGFGWGWDPYYYGYPYAYVPYGYAPYGYGYAPYGYGPYGYAPNDQNYDDNDQESYDDPPAQPRRYYRENPDMNQQQYQRPAPSQSSGYVGSKPAGPVRLETKNPQVASARPAVRNVIQALEAMPPRARRREIASGRYSTLSQREWRLVRAEAGLPARGR